MEDDPDHLGERLQQARGRAGLTVEDVVFKTRIPKSVVIALEAADFSVFSSPTYAKSFLSQYSAHLNVDARRWIDALQPSNFLGGEFVSPPWQGPEPDKEIRPVETAAGGNWLATLGLLALSAGIVLAALHGYRFLESRFGVEIDANRISGPVENMPRETKAPAVPAAAPTTLLPETASVREEETPPRAIVVRSATAER